ncbi:MAG: KUP/HAK/KT family potassium transporter [Nitrospirae bacterium]|nr:KUP/HAK/KT family potassium transporter [Nitrospirota bacterium]
MFRRESVRGVIKALGLVFGDIGTSPIYTVTVAFLILPKTPDNIMGVMSLIIWTMSVLVSLQYVVLAMRLSMRGEGGTIVLREILSSLLKDKKKAALVMMLSVIGISLLMGDGVITPAISILSAVEGIALIPGFENISRTFIVLLSGVIAIVLFSFQNRGTEKVAFAFGPITSVWFLALIFFGTVSIMEYPGVLAAVNPWFGIRFLVNNGWTGFVVLGEIFLCATGGEALYADMGHLGAKPIRHAWIGVFIALSVNYLGQGAFLMGHPEAKNTLFEMVMHHASGLYIPFLVLSVAATIIASQAMISGTFSIVYQAIATRIMPMFRVNYTSTELKSQIYIPSVNWFLLAAVLFIMIEFGESSRLAAAYGLAVTGTMTITGVMMMWIFHLRKKPVLFVLSFFVTCIDILYLSANFYKIPHGGYWSLVLGSLPFTVILIYTQGQKRLYRAMRFMPFEEFIRKFNETYTSDPKLKGSALYLIRDIKRVPAFITQTMFLHGIIYEDNIFLSVTVRSDPYGVVGYYKEDIANGLRSFEIEVGYMEVISAEDVMRQAGIDERAIYYGLEDISAENPVWKLFSLIKRVLPTFIRFYEFPSSKMHGVITKVNI